MKIKNLALDFSTLSIVFFFLYIIGHILTRLYTSITIPTENSWIEIIFLNLISSLIGAILAVLFGYVVFRWKFKTEVAGEYYCYTSDLHGEILWGKSILKYNPIFNRFTFTLESLDSSIQIYGTGAFFKNEYLVGSYGEPEKPLRRRCGSFFLVLNTNGDGFEGKSLAIDPNTNRSMPSVEEIIWKKQP